MANDHLPDYAAFGFRHVSAPIRHPDNIGEYITYNGGRIVTHHKKQNQDARTGAAHWGQVEAIERALDGDGECEEVLQLVASCRGALNGLMAELIEGHVRFHVLNPDQKTRPAQLAAADDLIAVVKRYFN